MTVKPKFPLLAKMLFWLFVHFAVLAGAFAIFVGWQLSIGLDSLLSGAAGDRLKTVATGQSFTCPCSIPGSSGRFTEC